jgi:hypothetical protein
MIPATPPAKYDAGEEARYRELVRQADAQNLKRNTNLTFVLTSATFRQNKIILTSPDGTEFYLTVTNAGVLGATAV